VVEDRLGPTGTSEPRVRGVRCGRGRCVVRYVASHRGRGKILEDQVKIMRALFADPKLREVKLLVHHQKFGRHKDEALPIFEITCDRAGYRRLARRGDESRCKTVMRTGQDREAPHAKDGRPGGRGGPPAGRGGGPPEQR
jgi:hypothetical protein